MRSDRRPGAAYATSRRPGGPNSLVAAAEVLTRDSTSLRYAMRSEDWQARAWGFYDTVGELRFGAGWIGNALSKVRLVAAAPADEPGDPPVPLTSGPAVDLVRALGGGVTGQAQMMGLFGVLLTIAGLGYLVGEPPDEEAGETVWNWQVLSNDDVRGAGDLIQRQTADGQWQDLADEAIVCRVWRPHPRRRYLPDAPTRGVLGPLRQIELLDQRIEADAVSRLAGAGVFVVPNEATFPKAKPDDPEDNFVPTLMEAMTVPITNRASAAAVVPLIIRVPGVYAEAFRHITFSTGFDDRLLTLRDAALRRLALGLDLPPEVVLGVGDANHWSAWAINEEAITLHAEPLAETVCHGLTVGYLQPGLAASGLDPSSAVIWYDTVDLRTPPDQSEDAIALHDRLVISDDALMRETGFANEDKPAPPELARRLATKIVLAAPALAPGMGPQIGLNVPPLPTAPGGGTPTTPVLPPPTEGQPPEQGERQGVAASIPVNHMSILVAADLLVARALERAGGRLRGAAARAGLQIEGGSLCDNQLLHTCLPGTDVTGLLSLDALMAGAWDRADTTAMLLGLDPVAFVDALDRYSRALLSTRTPHDLDRLASALGAASATLA